MSVKHYLMATTAAAVLAIGGVAQAQQSAPRSSGPAQPGIQSPSSAPSAATSGSTMSREMLHEVDDDKASVQSLGISAKDLADAEIHGSDGKKIGEVNKVLADSSNQVKAVTLDVGGFLGMGAREVIFPIEKLQKGSDAKKLQTSMTKAEIERLDEWADSKRGSEPRRGATDTPRNDPPRTSPAK